MNFGGVLKTPKTHFLLVLLCVVLTACEAQATPIALVNEPTGEAAFASAIPTNPPNLRYGIFSNADGYVSDLAELQSRATVEIFYEASRYADYDIVAAYGVFEGWQVSPISQQLALLLNPNLVPLDNAEIRALIPQALDSRSLVNALAINGMQANTIVSLSSAEIRTKLANLGYPDGLELSLAASPLLGVEQIMSDFAADNIRIQVVQANNVAHLTLSLAPEMPEGAIEIYRLPISYVAKDGISIEFSADGWPLPSR